jgi:hypothetical protein
MPRVATKLTPTKSGGWYARKRIPEDVQNAYAKLYVVQWEERLTLMPMSSAKARARHRDWLNEIEARVANIRAEQRGDGRTLTPMQARALSGEWYHWYVERHQARPQSAEHWEFFRDQINNALADAIDPYRDLRDPERQQIDDVWRITPEAREEKDAYPPNNRNVRCRCNKVDGHYHPLETPTGTSTQGDSNVCHIPRAKKKTEQSNDKKA